MSKYMPARRVLRKKQNGACCYCGEPMTTPPKGRPPNGGWPPKTETLEHLRRRSDGGKSNYDNLALACYDCNVGRGALDWPTYKSLKMGELVMLA